MNSGSLKYCRICKSDILENVINLGSQYITSRFPEYSEKNSTPKVDIILCICGKCSLLQLVQTTSSNELYEYEYGYRSGINNTMKNHLFEYQQEVINKVVLNKGELILDIGSNDATTLKCYSDEYTRIGIDPTGHQFKEYYPDSINLIPTYFTFTNFNEYYPNKKCKIVSSISMFYDLPDPVQFAKDIYSILDDSGIWTCEQSYVLSMFKTNSIDTICHEHLEYYSIGNIKMIADLAGFKIIDVFFNECNGGSSRVYFAKKESFYQESDKLIAILESEKVLNKEYYIKFMENCDREIKKLKDFIRVVNKNGKKIFIYGASTKGNCLLQYANITSADIPYAVERNLNKVGKMTSTCIPIIDEETMRSNPPDYLLVLPWHFRDEILKREQSFLNNSGQFIFPFPEVSIVGNKPKVLLTGCDGMIANYFIKQFEKDYLFYGIGNISGEYSSNITKYYSIESLENTILTIVPDIIIHLAGISNSNFALHNPIETINTNGLMAVHICDILYRNKLKTKLFNASSSEIYKGHGDYSVTDSDDSKTISFLHHYHPYSIAKMLSHNTILYYQTKYNLPFSNGIIFTTDSPLKGKNFLLNKVANHAVQWKMNKTPLELGNLNSYRNIIHASDVANAINVIVSQNSGQTFVICGNDSIKVLDLVLKMYHLAGIELIQKGDNYYSMDSLVLITNVGILNNESTPTGINGEAIKLKNLGWIPKYSIDDILAELIH